MTENKLRDICRAAGIHVSRTDFIREHDLVKLLPEPVTVRTLREWRRAHIGPKAVKMGTRHYYSLLDVAVALTPAEESDERRRKAEEQDGDTEVRQADDPSVFPKRAAQ
jgi:hypothetical protein